MIDLTKSPEGATHYRVTNTGRACWYIIGEGYYKYLYDIDVGKSDWDIGLGIKPVYDIKPINSWTIYNNTKPLSELSDEQRGLLLNYRCNGGATQVFIGEDWCDAPDGGKLISRHRIYRAKQKSERELFIEAALDAMKLHPDDLAKRDIGKMFDAGFKAPEDKQC